ncbi:MAG: VWA domain-containing protein [Phycisphaeraceae bacterium]|nr:MAG: VWA domain-containing protein [Phycisphaeraceae bacterium]
MTLLNLGLGLAGAACIAIPIIIHLLFRRKRKPVMWGAMRFLLEAYRRQRRRLTLEQLLLLATRCMVILLLALALGRPVLESAGALGMGGSRQVYIVIDNSLASSARTEGGESALDRHKRSAAEIISALGSSDRVGLITLGSPAADLVVPASSDHGAVRSMIEELDPTDAGADTLGAFERLRSELEREDTRSGTVLVAMLSDFLLGSADTASPLPRIFENTDHVQFLAKRPVESGPGNVQVVSVEPLRPVVFTGAVGLDGPTSEVVRVRLRRTGPIVAESGVTTVRLRVAAETESGDSAFGPGAAQTVVRWSPGQSEATAAVQVDLSAAGRAIDSGAAALIAEIDRDAIDGDNAYRRPVALRNVLDIGVIARRRFGPAPRIDRLDAADWLRLALRPTAISPIEVTDIEPASIDAPSLARLDAAMLTRPDLVDDDGWLRLRRFVENGGLLMVFPPAEPNVHLWGDAMQEHLGLSLRIAREATAHEPALSLSGEAPATDLLAPIRDELSDLAPPVGVFRTLAIEEAGAGMETLLLLSDGSPWIVAGSPMVEDETEAEALRDERGLVVYFSSAPTLSWTELPAKPLMVPLTHELTRQGVGRAHGSWSSRAGAAASAPARTVELRGLDGRAGDASHAVDERGRTTEPLRRAGLFHAVDARRMGRGFVAVNADIEAGRTDAQSPQAVQGWLAASGLGTPMWIDGDGPRGAGTEIALAGEQARSPVSLPLLIAALIFAVIELIMARFFSHAFREERGVGRRGAAGGAA